MKRSDYYEQMKILARETRARHSITSYRVMKNDMRRVYKAHGIKLDYWEHKLKNLRGAYFSDECGSSIMIAKWLPTDPMIFTMAHELKHHLVDQKLGLSYCDPSNERESIEIGAEVFAAEFIFPEPDFSRLLVDMGIGEGDCTPEALVRLKHDTKTTLSYAGLSKRAVFLGFAEEGSMKKIPWIKIEEKIYGEPVYKRIQRQRGTKRVHP